MRENGQPVQAQDCPYPQESVHPWGTDRSQRVCETCGGLLSFCPDCRQANRLLARFCRACGQAFPHLSWSLSGGEAASDLLRRTVSLPRQSIRSETAVAAPGALLCERGLLVLLGGRGELAAYLPFQAEPVWLKPILGVSSLSHAPTLLGGLLLLASEERLIVIDLVEQFRQSSSPSRRRVLSVRGKICAPLASDGRSRLAVLSREGEATYLQAFQLQGGRVQLLWTQQLEATPASLCISGDELLCLDQAAQLFQFSSGAPLSTLDFVEPPHHQAAVARVWDGRPVFYLSRADGSVYRLWHNEQGSSVQLAPPCPDPLFAWNCSQDDLVMCHGRRLRRVELKTGRLSELELPQYCTLAPWVGVDRTLVLSQEGSLYAVNLQRQTFQAEKSLKVEGMFQGAALAPVYVADTLAVCDTQGRLTQVACGN